MITVPFRGLARSLAGFALAAAIIAPVQVDARIYKWTDAEGNVVYSQTPPPQGVQAERVKEPPPPPEDPKKAMESLRERAKAFEDREQTRDKTKEEREAEAKQAAQQKKICDQLRKNLQILQTNNQVREKEDDGGYSMLTEEQRQSQIENTQKRIKEECDG